MKKGIMSLCILFVSFQMFAQDTITELKISDKQSKQIEKTFLNYHNEITAKSKDWESIMDYTYPKLFEILTREDLIKMLKKSFTTDLFDISFDQMEFNAIQKSISFKDIIYTKIKYKYTMAFHFKKAKDQTEKKFKEYVTFMLSLYKNKFKDAQVTKRENTIFVSGDKYMLAVNDKSFKKEWYFLEFLQNNEAYYSMFLPEEIATYISTKI